MYLNTARHANGLLRLVRFCSILHETGYVKFVHSNEKKRNKKEKKNGEKKRKQNKRKTVRNLKMTAKKIQMLTWKFYVSHLVSMRLDIAE